MAAIHLLINDHPHDVETAPDTPLLWVLRDTLSLTGTKYGCGMGFCGSCTVHLDGEAVIPLPKGKGRGIAAFASFGSYFAEVSIIDGNNFKIDRMVAAVDCGRAINPESVRSQTEGAVIYRLSAALKNEITIKNGAVEQTNFDGYDPIRINESPPIEVHILDSDEDPGGMGEPGLPPAAPAVANAIFAASGQRLRRLPFEFKPSA